LKRNNSRCGDDGDSTVKKMLLDRMNSSEDRILHEVRALSGKIDMAVGFSGLADLSGVLYYLEE
jgi:hypothetical protein